MSRVGIVLLLVAAMAGLAAGCGAETNRPALATPSASPSVSAEEMDESVRPPVAPPPNGTVVSILFEHGRLARKTGQVEVDRGSTVVLAVSTDIADDIHLHGYDRLAPTRPGDRALLEFTADRPGVFTAELERSRVGLFEVTVP